MAGLMTIEDRTYRFALQVVTAFKAARPRDRADWTMWQQLLEAGTSAGANSAESPGSQSRRDWLTRRYIALKETRESRFWLRLLRDSGTPWTPAMHWLLEESGELVAILTATVKTARTRDAK